MWSQIPVTLPIPCQNVCKDLGLGKPWAPVCEGGHSDTLPGHTSEVME